MPTPTRTVNGETREWNGSAWVPQPSSPKDFGANIGLHNPAAGVPGENPASNRPLDTNGLKQILTFLGSTAGGMLAPEGALPAIVGGTLGGAVGRVGGGALSALTSHAGGNLKDDLVDGGLQGFAQEALPAGLGLAARGLGRATDLMPPRLKGWTVPKIVDSLEEKLAGTPVATTSQWIKKGIDAGKNSLAGLKEAVFPSEPPTTQMSGITMTPEAVERNVAATNARDVDGFSHAQAGKLEGIPGAGQSKEIPYQAPASPGNTSLAGLKTSANGDLLSTYMDSLQGGVGSGQQSFEMDGKTFVPDGTGSHIAVPESWSNFVSDEPLSKADTMAPEDIDPHIGGSAPFSPDALPKVPASLDSLREAAFRQYANKPW